MISPAKTLLALALFAIPAAAQVQIVDQLLKLPANSCNDGATHVTLVLGHRIRPGNLDLTRYEGFAVHLTGTPGTSSCSDYLTATSVDYGIRLWTVATDSGGTMSVEIHASGINVFSVTHVSLGLLAKTPVPVPGIEGVLHLDPVGSIYLGSFTKMSFLSSLLTTLRAPSDPALRGIDFYGQGLHVNKPPKGLEYTTVTSFRF